MIRDGLVHLTGRLLHKIISGIGLEPGQKLHSQRRASIPAVKMAILEIVVLEVETCKDGALAKVVVDLHEFPATEAPAFRFFFGLQSSWYR